MITIGGGRDPRDPFSGNPSFISSTTIGTTGGTTGGYSAIVNGPTDTSTLNSCPIIYGLKRPPIRYVYDKASKRMVQVTC